MTYSLKDSPFAPLLTSCASGGGYLAFIGGGGKTTLMEELGEELHRAFPAKTVALTTTTKVWPPKVLPLIAEDDTDKAVEELKEDRLAYIGEYCEVRGLKKIEVPSWGVEKLATLADFILIEADGSHERPLKAHASWEPAYPDLPCFTIAVIGASGFNEPVIEVVHRPELFCRRMKLSSHAKATPELIAQEMGQEHQKEHLTFDVVFVNQCDESDLYIEAAQLFAETLHATLPDMPIYYGSARAKTCTRAD